MPEGKTRPAYDAFAVDGDFFVHLFYHKSRILPTRHRGIRWHLRATLRSSARA